MRAGLVATIATVLAAACSRQEPSHDALAADTGLMTQPNGKPVEAPLSASAPPKEVAPITVPAYTVVFKQNMIAPAGVLVEVVVPSLSRQTPLEDVARLATAILTLEAGDRLNIYATHAAYLANGDDDYGKRHPRALAEGYLGRVENGTFRPPPDWLK